MKKIILAGIVCTAVSAFSSPKVALVEKRLSDSAAPSPGITDLASTNDELSEGVVVIQGIFDSAGEKLLELKPVRYYSWHSRHPTPHQQKGRFIVEINYVSGEVTITPFDALVADDSSPGRTEHGFFEVIVPVSGKIASIRITDETRRTIFAVIDSSKISHDLATLEDWRAGGSQVEKLENL
jgi:hypothetical protein